MLSFRAQISRWDYLLAFVSGLAFVFAFEPFGLWPVAFLVPALFFWMNLKPMPKGQRMRLAWVFGIGVFAGGAHWIYVSIHFFGGANSFIATAMVLLFVIGVALCLMLFGWIVSKFPYQAQWLKLLVIFPAAWALTEWFRTWFLTGFPWLQIGHSQADTWFGHFAPLIGSIGVSWVVAVCAGALVLLWLGAALQKLLALTVLILSASLAYLLQGVTWTSPVDEPIHVTMIQANIPQQDKWIAELRNAHIQKHLDLTAPHLGETDLIIWSETAIPDTFQNSMEDLILPFQAVLQEAGAEFLVGGFHRVEDSVYNAIMHVGEDFDVYGKQHLVPFSEYVPLLEYIRWLERYVILPYSNVNAWRGKVNLNVVGQPMRLSVCYEDAYGTGMTKGLPEATMLVNVSNDAWFTGSIQAAQHAQIARLRSMETGRYLLRATNNGISAIINDKGKVIATAPQYEEATITGFAQPMKGYTPFIFWGNWLLIPLLILALVLAWWLGRNQFR